MRETSVYTGIDGIIQYACTCTPMNTAINITQESYTYYCYLKVWVLIQTVHLKLRKVSYLIDPVGAMCTNMYS